MTTTLSNDVWGRSVVLEDDGVTYTVTNSLDGAVFSLSFPGGTDIVEVYEAINAIAPQTLPIAQAIAANIANAKAGLVAFSATRYSLDQRLFFHSLYEVAKSTGLTNRAAYIYQLFTWAQSVAVAAAAYIATVSAMTDPVAVTAKSPDFGILAASDPNITVPGAMAITT